MVTIGLLFFAGAIGTATALAVQNRGQDAVSVRAFDHTLALPPYSIMVVGAAIAVIAVIGLALMRMGAGRVRRLRHELDTLRAEYARLTDRCTDPESTFFFENFDQDASAAPGGRRPGPGQYTWPPPSR